MIGVALLLGSFLVYIFFLPGQIQTPRQAKTDFSGRPLFQYSTLGALMAGLYEGRLTYDELALHGDMGLGTFNRLNGEMAALDGVFYRVSADGHVAQVRGDERTPFAMTVFFDPDETLSLPPGLNFEQLKSYLDQKVPGRNLYQALRIDGVFPLLKLGAMPEQKPPFKPLPEVIGEQKTFEYKDISGTLVGFRTPAYMGAIGVTGYHFHFLSSDRSRGGHLNELTTGSGTFAFESIGDFKLILPDTDDFKNIDLQQFSAGDVIHLEDSRKTDQP